MSHPVMLAKAGSHGFFLLALSPLHGTKRIKVFLVLFLQKKNCFLPL